jgi:hypothetical protein
LAYDPCLRSLIRTSLGCSGLESNLAGWHILEHTLDTGSIVHPGGLRPRVLTNELGLERFECGWLTVLAAVAVDVGEVSSLVRYNGRVDGLQAMALPGNTLHTYHL